MSGSTELVKKTFGNLPGPGPGRPKGIPNKDTIAVKDMIIGALHAAGNDVLAAAGQPKRKSGAGIEYLRHQAKAKPAAFMALVGKVVPLQVILERPPPTLDLSDLTDEQLEVLQKAVKGLLPIEQDEPAGVVIEGVVAEVVEKQANE